MHLPRNSSVQIRMSYRVPGTDQHKWVEDGLNYVIRSSTAHSISDVPYMSLWIIVHYSEKSGYYQPAASRHILQRE